MIFAGQNKELYPHIILHFKQGRIQDFLKEGALKLRTDRTSAPVETGGV